MNTSTPQDSLGFTLIELMITITILALLVTIGIPSYKKIVERNAITTAGNDLYASLQLARSEAVSREESVRVEADPGGWSAGWNVVIVASAEEIDRYRMANSTIGITPKGNFLAPDAGVVTYTSTGRALTAYNEANDHFEILSNTQKRCVIMSTTGRPFVKKEEDCP